jgi:hypothetical protein
VRSIVAAVVALLIAGTLAATPAPADPTTSCNEPGGSDAPNRIVFCGSPRRYAPRWFRSPSLVGVKELGADCTPYLNMVAQAPDGLFLTCMAQNGRTLWVRGDT